MGQVWRAVDPTLEREVAIKVLPAAIASSAESRARFLREARLAARLNHPNIATIFAVEERDSAMYLVMELVEGFSLARLTDGGPTPEASVIDIALQVTAAIGEAHSHGIIHRDIKPENIMVSPRGVKVLDFGIARDLTSVLPEVTQAGTIMGTPHYMSPEQAQGFPLTAQTDIFSLGAVLYEMLSGQRAFEGETMMGILLGVISRPHAPLKNVRPEMAAIVDRCLKKKAADRFADVAELANALCGARQTIATQPPVVDNATVVLQQRGAPAERALVADDDPIVRQIFRTTLEKLGYQVDQAADGTEAIRHLKNASYALLITDLLMPRLDGWSVLDFVRSSPARRPPRVFITTGMRDVALGSVEREIVNGVIAKPVAASQIRELIEAAH